MRIYGIDLGTTNSLIGRGNELYSGLMSSSVNMKTRKQVPRNMSGEDIVSSYKTDMSLGAEGLVPIECSGVILSELVKQARRKFGEDVENVIISVPAYFSMNQREAVYKAAKIANLNVVQLINEPTAAAIYTCRNMRELVVVFDLGGGTFDVSLVDSRSGVYTVIATDGLVIGGDNLDTAISDFLMGKAKLPMRLKSSDNKRAFKDYCCIAKENIQANKKSVEVLLSAFQLDRTVELTVDEYKSLVVDVFSPAIDKTKLLVDVNTIYGDEPKVIFVGGSTMCPYLRELLIDELKLGVIESDIQADYVVARGVALFAEMLESGDDVILEDVTKRLCIEDSSGRGLEVIASNTMVPCSSEIPLTNSNKCKQLRLNLYQGDSVLAKDNDFIGVLVYDYGMEVEAQDGMIILMIKVSVSGTIEMEAQSIFGEKQKVVIERK